MSNGKVDWILDICIDHRVDNLERGKIDNGIGISKVNMSALKPAAPGEQEALQDMKL